MAGVMNAGRLRGVNIKQCQFHFHSVLGYRLIHIHLNSAMPMRGVENVTIVSKSEKLVRGAGHQHPGTLDDDDTTDDS